MWHEYAFLAHEIIRDRQREAAAMALARLAGGEDAARGAGPSGRARQEPARVGAPRRVLAAVLRRVEAMAELLAAAARGLATRLEGRVEGRVA